MDRILIPREALRGTNSLHHFKQFVEQHLPTELGGILQTRQELREFHSAFKERVGRDGITRKDLEHLLHDFKKDDGGAISYKEARQIEKSFRGAVEGGKLGDKGEDYFPDRL